MSHKAKHTPGPWEAGYTEGKANEVYHAETLKRVAQCCAKGRSKPESDANARLIAASPDMLDALKAARAVLTCILGTDAESRIIAEQIASIDAVLAKVGEPLYLQQFGRGVRVKTDMGPILAGLPGGVAP